MSDINPIIFVHGIQGSWLKNQYPVYYVFYTPTACGGVKGGVIVRHYGIRENVAQCI